MQHRAEGHLVLMELGPADDPRAQALAAMADVVVVVCSTPSAPTAPMLRAIRLDLDRAGCGAVVAVVVDAQPTTIRPSPVRALQELPDA